MALEVGSEVFMKWTTGGQISYLITGIAFTRSEHTGQGRRPQIYPKVLSEFLEVRHLPCLTQCVCEDVFTVYLTLQEETAARASDILLPQSIEHPRWAPGRRTLCSGCQPAAGLGHHRSSRCGNQTLQNSPSSELQKPS